MKHNIQPLTDLEMAQTNGGDGIIAYDPVTGKPFPEENGGYPEDPRPVPPPVMEQVFTAPTPGVG